MKSVSIIIPTYNESHNLPLLVEEVFSRINTEKEDVEIIFVDDNSPDGTGEIAEKLRGTFPVRVIHRAGKNGLGSAVREGFQLSTRPILGVMDADLSHDPSIIRSMLDAIGEYDITIGGRFENGSMVENWIWWRKIISTIGVKITKWLSRGVKDPLSGYFFMKRSVIEGVSLTTNGYKILFEILVKGNYTKIKEFPYQFRVRKYSTSKLNWHEHVLFLKQLFVYSWYRIKNLK